MFASSVRRGPLAGSAVARNPANGRQPGLLHYPAVTQPGSIATSPASSGIGMYICTVIHIARNGQCAYSMFLMLPHGVHCLVRGLSCVGLVMAKVCCLKQLFLYCACVSCSWCGERAAVHYLSPCSLPFASLKQDMSFRSPRADRRGQHQGTSCGQPPHSSSSWFCQFRAE